MAGAAGADRGGAMRDGYWVFSTFIWFGVLMLLWGVTSLTRASARRTPEPPRKVLRGRIVLGGPR